MEEILSFQQGPLIADIAAHVFSLLSVIDKQNIAQVCRYWRRIVYLPCLWKDVSVELPLHPTHELIESFKIRRITRITCLRSKEEDLSALFSSVPNLTHINVIGCPQVSEEFLVKAIPSLLCLKHVAFRRCRQVTNRLLTIIRNSSLSNTLKSFALEDCAFVTHVGFKSLVRKLTGLESLDLIWCVKLNNSCLQVLSDSCPKLSSLKIQSCDWLTYSGLEFVAKKLKNIKCLNLNHCYEVDDESLKFVADNLDLQHLYMQEIPNLTLETMAYIANHLAGLQSLSFGSEEWIIDPNYFENLEDIKLVFEGVSKLQELESLTINVCEDHYDEATRLHIVSSLKKLPKLKMLDLGMVKSTSDETWMELTNYLPNLEKLSFCSDNIGDVGISALCSKLKYLKALDLSCYGLTDKASIGGFSSKCVKLETLNLECLNMTNAGIQYLSSHFSSLTNLVIMECIITNDSDVELLALGMPQLLQLHLTNCSNVKDQGAIAIGKHLKNLRYLSLTSTKTSDKGFVFVSQNLTKLHTFAVAKCLISDKALVEGSVSLGNLKDFEFGSEKTTDKGLEEAVKHLTGLVEMTLISTKCITVKGIEIIVNGLPNLNHLGIEGYSHLTLESIQHLQSKATSKISVFSD